MLVRLERNPIPGVGTYGSEEKTTARWRNLHRKLNVF